jgi:hypothetical protein
MTIHEAVVGIGQRRAIRRAGRALPWIGLAIAIVGVASAIRSKGVIRGSVDSALNAMPVLGSLKVAAESIRGRDFIAPKARPA